MTQVLDEPSTRQDVRAPRRRRMLAPVVVLVLVGLVAGWIVVGLQPSLREAGWSGPLDARQVGDGISGTRYVLSADAGEQVVLGSVRNEGRFPVTLLGVDEERGLPWVTATFRDRGRPPLEVGYRSVAAAQDAVTASSVTLAPGASADVLVRFDPPEDLEMSEGSFSETDGLLLSVRHLGVGSTQHVTLLPEPVVLVGGPTFARLEREGRFR